ncbi:MAG: FAD-dependent oxidoreductase [Clostridia bacterium]|nr:FAD-dependent oxidoreductase [Clostridia bacterium]
MKKILSVILALALMLSCTGAFALTAGEYEGTAQGFGGLVTVKVTVDDAAVTAVEITADAETPAIGGAAVEGYKTSLVGVSDAEAVEVVAGATVTSTAVKNALAAALAAASGEAAPEAELAFTAGTYTASAKGYVGNVELNVTFSETAVTGIEVAASSETAHVGTVAYDLMIPQIIEANGTGVDAIGGATFTSKAIRDAVNAAAEQAACTNMNAFTTATLEVVAQAPIEETYDIVIVGAGGAGMAAAAQAAQDGNTVLVIEKNAEIGGNTLVSGGQYQSVMPYLVWDPENPDATTGVYEFTGETFDKVKNTAKGNIETLRDIMEWNEEPFNAEYFADHEYIAGDIKDLKHAGVHAEYLPVLQALKAEIAPYLEWADAQMAAGVPEVDVTLFSTVNLHIFQTYYGGLRQSADGSEWIYGDIDLVKQFIEGGQGLKEWLEAQGSVFDSGKQLTLIGALWYRENLQVGANFDADGDGVNETGNWGVYFAAPRRTLLETSATAAQNKIMTRTTATELVVTDGRVTGVKAEMFDGTQVTANATKGVIIATGGYAANIEMCVANDIYWDDAHLVPSIETTNRSSLQGDGIVMAQAIGAATTGMGYTQMMPISWIDDGDLAFGSGAYCIYINPTTGKRFVNETSERDVLSLNEFRNGIEVNGVQGVFMEIANADERVFPYAYLNADRSMQNHDVEWRQYVRTVDEFAELFAQLGFACDANTVIETIKAYDMAYMTDGEYPDVEKTGASRLIGTANLVDGKYDVDSYTLDGVELRVRIMAPSTHHTMGGLKVDIDRHVLDTEGNVIPGLYAAGEVTGGFHGGNRLGGNAIIEIYVSGRTAAQAATADAQ